LNVSKNKKVVGQKIHSWLKWRMKGDACTNEFFATIKEKSRALIVTKL
jgi:hypothetical protein